jgi:hypothetical protein
LRQRVTHAQHQAPFERDQLALLSCKNLFQARTRGWMWGIALSQAQLPRHADT